MDRLMQRFSNFNRNSSQQEEEEEDEDGHDEVNADDDQFERDEDALEDEAAKEPENPDYHSNNYWVPLAGTESDLDSVMAELAWIKKLSLVVAIEWAS